MCVIPVVKMDADKIFDDAMKKAIKFKKKWEKQSLNEIKEWIDLG